MSQVELALGKVRAVIGKDNTIISHYFRNRSIVAIVAKKNVGTHSTPVSACFHISQTI